MANIVKPTTTTIKCVHGSHSVSLNASLLDCLASHANVCLVAAWSNIKIAAAHQSLAK